SWDHRGDLRSHRGREHALSPVFRSDRPTGFRAHASVARGVRSHGPQPFSWRAIRGTWNRTDPCGGAAARLGKRGIRRHATDRGPHPRGPDRMIQRAEQANIVGLRSKDFVQWVEENIDAPIKRGPGGAILERLKAGLVGEFFNWAKRNSTWPLHFGIMCCAIE